MVPATSLELELSHDTSTYLHGMPFIGEFDVRSSFAGVFLGLQCQSRRIPCVGGQDAHRWRGLPTAMKNCLLLVRRAGRAGSQGLPKFICQGLRRES